VPPRKFEDSKCAVAVFGATGGLGRHAVLQLLDAGQVVGEFTQAVLQVTDDRAAVDEMRGSRRWSPRNTTPQRREPKAASLGCRVEAKGLGSKTRKATWLASFPSFSTDAMAEIWVAARITGRNQAVIWGRRDLRIAFDGATTTALPLPA
jgi:hypothetical protein